MIKPPKPLPTRFDDVYLTTNQVAVITRMSKSFWEKLRCSGEGPEYSKVGGCVRYRPQDVRDYMRARARSSTSVVCTSEAVGDEAECHESVLKKGSS